MSSLFNLRVPLKEKDISHHPWEKTVKDLYSNKIKHAHNSANNPKYPEPKKLIKDTSDKERTKFTVIGNRVTEEFIYCANIAKVLHKYRKKSFEPPVIRGVTSVEWPIILNDLKAQYGGLAYCLKSQVAVLINDKTLIGDVEFKELILAKYIYHVPLDYYKESVGQFAGFVKGSSRPCIYLHISINDVHVGTMIFMLYSDIVPYTCENFLRLCQLEKGGYSGTPIHRIVKDGWIQCGGFGLKSSDLTCENFIVPHDRRGVLAMANDGRHIDCSTQFFVLLQPAPWMAHKYVAFGQLIDGEAVLKKIESIPTWYESPTSCVFIHKTGILNIDCHDIMINRGAKEYIQGHIEDLFALGEILYQELLLRVFLEIELREQARLEMKGEDDVAEEEKLGLPSNIHATERFMRKKEDIQKQIDKNPTDPKTSKVKGQQDKVEPKSPKPQIDQKLNESKVSENENNDFDVSVYDYEPEEYAYQHVTVPGSPSIVVKPEKPYYIPLTDVLYPGEVDSNYDLKRFLRGNYCHESDLETKDPQKGLLVHKGIAYPSEVFHVVERGSHYESDDESLDSEDEKDIKRYLKLNADRVSFAGGVIRNIARGTGKINIFEGNRKSELITDDELRRVRITSMDIKAMEHKKISISVPNTDHGVHREIKRRQTGFVRMADLEKIHIIEKHHSNISYDDEDSASHRKVRIDPTAVASAAEPKVIRRPTAFVKPSEMKASDSDMEVRRQSVLTRLYDETQNVDVLPTLKDYKPQMAESSNKNLLLTFSPNSRIRSEDRSKDQFRRPFSGDDSSSFDQILSIQHGKKFTRKISSDYVKTIDQMEQKNKNERSIRSLEFAKTRPTLTVADYQAKNQSYKEQLKNEANEEKTKIKGKTTSSTATKSTGLRLPGDSPLYSEVELEKR